MKKIISLMFIIIFIATASAGCGTGSQSTNVPPPAGSPSASPSAAVPSGTPGLDNTNTAIPGSAEDEAVNALLGKMTLEEKVGQVFIMSFRALYGSDSPHTVLSERDKEMIRNNHIGGVIFFTEDMKDIRQTSNMIRDAQNAGSIPLFVAIDEEGGSISRLNKLPSMHSTVLPTKKQVGSTNDPELAKKEGKLIAEEISSLGFNMNFAPVADINTNPDNPVIGDRSFGDDPQLVSQMVVAEMEGMHEGNIITVFKHFPGHGDTSADSHTGAVTIEHDRSRLDKVEFVPFLAGINAGTDGIMAAHIKVPKIESEDVPATLSKKILTDLLRNEMKFKGLIITDALDMGAITQFWNPAEASVKAFEAGADILLMPASPDAGYNGLLAAVKNGTVSEQRLDESVKRILHVKYKYQILSRTKSALDPEKVLGSPEHADIAKEIWSKVTGK